MTQHDHLKPFEPPPQEHSVESMLELCCHATTRSGQPCRNRPLEGQLYCHVHAPLAGQTSAVPSAIEVPITITSGYRHTGAEETIERRSKDAVQAIEIDVRTKPAEQPDPQDLGLDLLRLLRENCFHLGTQAAKRSLELAREIQNGDYLDPDFWRGLSMLLRYQVEQVGLLTQRRLHGDYSTDPYGMDPELIDIVRPFFRFMYQSWWRVSSEGVTHVPDDGSALLVANHSGVFPWDSAMITMAVLEEHPRSRMVRSLYLDWFASLPMIAPLFAALGQVQAHPDNTIRLLNEGQLVTVFPEGIKGVGKRFSERYRLARFGRGGFVQMALRTGAPMIPVAVIGAEETYPMLGNLKPLARLLGFPFFPITPLFPWLGPLGLIPLPSKWTIVFGTPIPTKSYSPGSADDPLLVTELTEQIRSRIQTMIDHKLASRTSVFAG